MLDLNKYIKICDLGGKYSNIKDCYAINVLTKVVKNTETNNICHWVDTCTESLDKRVEVLKDNGIASSLQFHSLAKALRTVGIGLLEEGKYID